MFHWKALLWTSCAFKSRNSQIKLYYTAYFLGFHSLDLLHILSVSIYCLRLLKLFLFSKLISYGVIFLLDSSNCFLQAFHWRLRSYMLSCSQLDIWIFSFILFRSIIRSWSWSSWEARSRSYGTWDATRLYAGLTTRIKTPSATTFSYCHVCSWPYS